MTTGHPENKFLEDLKKRIAGKPGSVNYKMLVRAIPAEIQSKSIPRFVKDEICRRMKEVKKFVADNEWARKSVTKSLMKLYNAVVDVKANHEGYVRVEYANFRECFDVLKKRTEPPQLIALPPDMEEKISKIRSEVSGVSVLNYRDNLDIADCTMDRRHVLNSPTIQHYRAAGMRIFGRISQQIDVPQIVADAQDVQKLINEVRAAAETNRILQTRSVNIALAAAEEFLKDDTLWILMCAKLQQALTNILEALVNDDAKTVVIKEMQRFLDSVILFVKTVEDWKKIEEVNIYKLKSAAQRGHMTPDEMLMQAKRLQHRNRDDCI